LAKELLEAPELPEDIDFSDLDEEARRELRTLPKGLAETVGKHLVAAGGLIDTDPEAALAHARYAKAKASRVPIVREALGLVSYHAGNWAEALSELRAVRRMTRTDTHIAVIADAERALGRPERALDLAKEAAGSQLPREVEIELRIVAAGARRDLGQFDAAVVSLQGPDLNAAKRDPWSARLFYAYADNLAAASRRDEAIQWFLNAAEADEEEETDAADRAAALSNDDEPALSDDTPDGEDVAADRDPEVTNEALAADVADGTAEAPSDDVAAELDGGDVAADRDPEVTNEALAADVADETAEAPSDDVAAEPEAADTAERPAAVDTAAREDAEKAKDAGEQPNAD
jgi:tetratricopeptide (TPR) repeat protein